MSDDRIADENSDDTCNMCDAKDERIRELKRIIDSVMLESSKRYDKILDLESRLEYARLAVEDMINSDEILQDQLMDELLSKLDAKEKE